jgi:nucleotide-binding universal stress UspA family protein
VKLLLAVDGSESAVRATQEIIETAGLYKETPEIELVTVHLPVPPVGGFSGVVVTRDMIEGYYREEGERALAPSRQLLDTAHLEYTPHILVGDIAPALVEHAEKSGSQMIYMGTRGRTAISNLVLGSVPTKVLHLARVPVVLVP